MNRKSIIFFLLLLPIIICSQIFKFHSEKEKKAIENISPLLHNINNIDTLKKVIQKEIVKQNITDNYTASIIENLFIAKRLADINNGDSKEISALFSKAISTAETIQRNDLYTWCSVNYGFHLYTYRQFRYTLPYFTKTMRTIESLNEDEIIEFVDTYTKLGYFSSTLREYERSVNYLEKALTKANFNEKNYSDILDNVSYNQMKLGRDDQATKNLDKALESARKTNNTIRIAKILGNKSQIAFTNKDFTKAEQYLLEDYRISDSLKSNQNTTYVCILLGKVYLETNQQDKAESFLKKGLHIAQNDQYLKSFEYSIMELFQQIAEKRGDVIAELNARKRLDELREILSHMDGDDALMQMKWATEKDQYISKIEAEKKKINEEKILKSLSLFAIVVLIVIFLYVYNKNKRKHIEEKELFSAKVAELLNQKSFSETKLDSNKKTLKAYKTYLSEKNEQIESLQGEIETIKNSTNFYSEKQSIELQRLLDSHLMTEENWEKFKQAYKVEYQEDYLLLNQKFPDLTDSNLRIIILTKLGMNNNEISRILGVTLDAVKKAKQRLRKKYETDYDILVSSVESHTVS